MHLYDFLLAGGREARKRVPTDLDSERATMDDGLLGPFRLRAASRASLTLRNGVVVDADGIESAAHVEPETDFYVRTAPGVDGVLITPVALAMPAPLVVDFAVYWEANRAVAR